MLFFRSISPNTPRHSEESVHDLWKEHMIHEVCSLTIRAITLDPFREGKKKQELLGNRQEIWMNMDLECKMRTLFFFFPGLLCPFSEEWIQNNYFHQNLRSHFLSPIDLCILNLIFSRQLNKAVGSMLKAVFDEVIHLVLSFFCSPL